MEIGIFTAWLGSFIDQVKQSTAIIVLGIQYDLVAIVIPIPRESSG